jgi:hypothetical protein
VQEFFHRQSAKEKDWFMSFVVFGDAVGLSLGIDCKSMPPRWRSRSFATGVRPVKPN